MLSQLPNPFPIDTPKGKAWAIAIIDYGPHWDLLWVTFLHESGECWTFNNAQIRQEKNYTFGLTRQSPIPDELPRPIMKMPSAKPNHANGNGYQHAEQTTSGAHT